MANPSPTLRKEGGTEQVMSAPAQEHPHATIPREVTTLPVAPARPPPAPQCTTPASHRKTALWPP